MILLIHTLRTHIHVLNVSRYFADAHFAEILFDERSFADGHFAEIAFNE